MSSKEISQQRIPLKPKGLPVNENYVQCYSEMDGPSKQSTLANKRLHSDSEMIGLENEPILTKKSRTKSSADDNINISNSQFSCVLPCNDLHEISNNHIGNSNSNLNCDSLIPNNCTVIESSFSNDSYKDVITNNLVNDNTNLLTNSNKLKAIDIAIADRNFLAKFAPNSSSVSESDNEDLEEDDNYLDSSESEEQSAQQVYTDLNCPEDEESCAEDDQSVISCITVGSTCSLKSAASEAMSSICMNENGVASNEDGSLLYSNVTSSTPLKPLLFSLFPHVPPVINFCKYDETTETLPDDVVKLLKWKFTSITPLVVRKTILNSNYKIVKKTVNWSGIWGKHMKSNCFKEMKDFQKVNHFPGTFQIGRKDRLWKNIAKLQSKFGKEEFGFIPKTFVLPSDLSSLKSAFLKKGVKKKWIVKPPASARGTGIKVIDKWEQLSVEDTVVVQRYISRPYLINNTKFDIRIYVLVTSFHPLRIFLYEDGLVRFASVKYQTTSSSLADRFMHLTNYSVNKSSSSYTQNEDAGHCQGHKWTLKTLWGFLKAQEIDTGALWNKIVDIVIKTIIAGENEIVIRTKKYTKNMYNCFELFGFDIILDEKLRPWLLEVNISPSLQSASSLDHSVKGPLIADLLNLVGFHIPDKLTPDRQMEIFSELNMTNQDSMSSLSLDRRIYTRLLTFEEQSKHLRINGMSRSNYLVSALENLQPNDLRHLIIAEDQLQRAGRFVCIFPTNQTFHYLGFLSKVRYYNRLMDAWETAYSSSRESGIEVLQRFCAEKIHLKVTSRFRLPKTAFAPPSDLAWKDDSPKVNPEVDIKDENCNSTQNPPTSTLNPTASTQVSSDSTSKSPVSTQVSLNSTVNPSVSSQVSLNSTLNPSNSAQVSSDSTSIPLASTQAPSNSTVNPFVSTQASSVSTQDPSTSTFISDDSTQASSNPTLTPLVSEEVCLTSTYTSSTSNEVSSKSTVNPSVSTQASSTSTSIPDPSTQASSNSTVNSSFYSQSSSNSTSNSTASIELSRNSTLNPSSE